MCLLLRPRPEISIAVTRQNRAEQYFVFYTSEPIEHNCTVASWNVVYAGLHKGSSNAERHWVQVSKTSLARYKNN